MVKGYAYDVENKLRMSLLRFVEDVIDKHFGGYVELPHDIRVLISGMIEDRVEQIMSDLR